MPDPYVPFPDCVEAVFNFTWRTIPCANTLMFKFDEGSPATADLISLGIGLRNWYQELYQDAQTPEVQLDNIKMTVLTTQSSPTFTYTAGLPLLGLTNAQSVTNNTAFCVSFGTIGRGRSARGRNYLLGLDASQLVDNYWQSAYVNPLVTKYADLMSLAGTIGWIWGVGSRRLNGAVRTLGLFQTITSVTAKTLRATTMRGRLT
jgi:hypothetical protein